MQKLILIHEILHNYENVTCNNIILWFYFHYNWFENYTVFDLLTGNTSHDTSM